MSTAHLYASMLADGHAWPSNGTAPSRLGRTAALVAAVAVIACLCAVGRSDGTDRSEWSGLPCVSFAAEAEGRTAPLHGRRAVCAERATVGPVMPSGWRP
jgi:hypothetical protein